MVTARRGSTAITAFELLVAIATVAPATVVAQPEPQPPAMPPAPPAPPVAPAPPAPPKPKPPPAAAPAPPSEEPFDHDAHMHASRERHLKSMETSGLHFERGVWSYGDYKTDVGATTPHDCARACEADEGCLHWNFHVVHHRCDLKGDSSGHNNDAPDWISGNARRYAPAAPPKPARPSAEL
mmetsp:Transcript_91826/g.230718  ORF Transcript_91826/g.230718 Transcript_91826/m.230718 type:complete len:182 (+) Transcript_91826:176-721(+)